jgi:Na+-translocating ferredoxin:NAD+ oxidoreductase subunit G
MKTVLHLVLVLTLTALTAAAALAMVYDYAQPKIAHHKAVALKEAISVVHPGMSSKSDTTIGGTNAIVCSGADGVLLGYAVTAKGNGYQGLISLIFGLTPDRTKITAIKVLEHAETPGLGALIDSHDKFGGKFEGLDVSNGITCIKNATEPLATLKATGKIDAITGATISSEAVAKIMNKALDGMNGKGGS